MVIWMRIRNFLFDGDLDADPEFYLIRMWIRMRIHADPDPQL